MFPWCHDWSVSGLPSPSSHHLTRCLGSPPPHRPAQTFSHRDPSLPTLLLLHGHVQTCGRSGRLAFNWNAFLLVNCKVMYCKCRVEKRKRKICNCLILAFLEYLNCHLLSLCREENMSHAFYEIVSIHEILKQTTSPFKFNSWPKLETTGEHVMKIHFTDGDSCH